MPLIHSPKLIQKQMISEEIRRAEHENTDPHPAPN